MLYESSLFRFKFDYCCRFKVDHLKSFFNNWKNRPPMILELYYRSNLWRYNIAEEYVVKGIIRKYENDSSIDFGNFKWMQNKSIAYYDMDHDY